MLVSKRAIVEVRSGPSLLSSHKTILTPGRTLHVGRSNLADLALPHDAGVSAKHLALTWDGESCHVRDLDSAKGSTRAPFSSTRAPFAGPDHCGRHIKQGRRVRLEEHPGLEWKK